MNKYFHSNLKYLRGKNGIEQLELANMIGLKSASAVSEWEKGIRIPSAGVLSDLANIFRVSIDNLMNVNLEKFSVGGSTPIPLVGTIAAGTPILAEKSFIYFIPPKPPKIAILKIICKILLNSFYLFFKK